MTNDRWGAGCSCKHGGYYNCADKFTPGEVPQHKWEKCTSVDLRSWGYRRNMKIVELMDLPDIVEVGEITVAYSTLQHRPFTGGLCEITWYQAQCMQSNVAILKCLPFVS